MRRMMIVLGILVLLLAGLVGWQIMRFSEDGKLPGRKVDYHAIYDRLWDVACDTAVDGSDAGCYVQYVDVYRPRPDFAAAMVEVVMHPGDGGRPDPHIRFDIEPGLSFADARLWVETPQGDVLASLAHCPGNTCRFSGEVARTMLLDWRDGAALYLEIGEGRAAPARLRWPLGNMAAILDDFATQRAKRGLP